MALPPPTAPALSRRSLLRALGGGAALGALAGCGRARGVRGARRPAADRSAREMRLTWANWPLYIDTDDSGRKRPTLEAFERRTGIDIDYVEEINHNDEFFGEISPALMNHQPTDRDLIVISGRPRPGRPARPGTARRLRQAPAYRRPSGRRCSRRGCPCG